MVSRAGIHWPSAVGNDNAPVKFRLLDRLSDNHLHEDNRSAAYAEDDPQVIRVF